VLLRENPAQQEYSKALGKKATAWPINGKAENTLGGTF
jgi:hypothetical protein